MAVVRKFVHLLDHSDQDFQEELDLMRLREEVITNIRSNQQLENDLNLMDIKIGLLVKNKITLQEVVSHSKKLTKKNKGELSNLMMMNKQKGGLKALSKEKRKKLEAYQFLFYLLQVNPINSNPRIVWKSTSLQSCSYPSLCSSDKSNLSGQADLSDATEQVYKVHGFCHFHIVQLRFQSAWGVPLAQSLQNSPAGGNQVGTAWPFRFIFSLFIKTHLHLLRSLSDICLVNADQKWTRSRRSWQETRQSLRWWWALTEEPEVRTHSGRSWLRSWRKSWMTRRSILKLTQLTYTRAGWTRWRVKLERPGVFSTF